MNKVTELRRSKGMTQEQFAEYCGVSRISIARYETDVAISRESDKKYLPRVMLLASGRNDHFASDRKSQF